MQYNDKNSINSMKLFSVSDSNFIDALDIVSINNLKGKTIIGICDDELNDPQEICIDISMGIPFIRACNSDNINHTLDYDKVRGKILEILKTHRLKLLEALAEKIANVVLDDFGAHWTRIKVIKPRKYNDVDSVGVVIERRTKNVAKKSQNILKVIGAGHVPKIKNRATKPGFI